MQKKKHTTVISLNTWPSFQKKKKKGVSNYGVNHLQELLDQKPEILPAVNQIEVHPWLARPDIIDYCHEKNIAVQGYSPLCQAIKLEDDKVKAIAAKYSKTPAQILIRWSLQHGNIVIPKSAKKERIQENANVFDCNLTDEDMTVLDSLNENFVCGKCTFCILVAKG